MAISQLTAKQATVVRGSIVDANNSLPPLADVFEPCASENRPGGRLLDLFADRVAFFPRSEFPKVDSPPPSPDHADVAAHALWVHEHIVIGADSSVTHLDELRNSALSERNTVVCITACSVPTVKQFQSTCSWVVQHGSAEWIHRYVAGRVRTPDAELSAIRFAIESALLVEGVDRIVIFTLHMSAAKTACDPSVHSSQSHSLVVCRALSKWFTANAAATIDFVDVPSKDQWAPHLNVNNYLRTLPRVPGIRPVMSLDSVRSWATEEVIETWKALFFRDPTYRGQHFLQLLDTKGNLLKPSYLGGGSWLSQVKRTDPPSLTARMTRCILGHAPIGDYFRRFNISEPHGCVCDGEPLQTRDHLLYHCPRRDDDAADGRDWLLPTLLKFLRTHPWAFASGPREGVG